MDDENFNKPFSFFGMDYVFGTYKKGDTKTLRPIPVRKETVSNEAEHNVPSLATKNIYDTLELFVAELASRQNKVRSKYPNLTKDELNAATSANFNATNKYFAELMSTGNYKDKYKVNIGNIQIPNPQPYNKNTTDRSFFISAKEIPQEYWHDDNYGYNKQDYVNEPGFDSYTPNNPLFQRVIHNWIHENTYNVENPYLDKKNFNHTIFGL